MCHDVFHVCQYDAFCQRKIKVSRNPAPVYLLSANAQWDVFIYKNEGKEYLVQVRVLKSVSSCLYHGLTKE